MKELEAIWNKWIENIDEPYLTKTNTLECMKESHNLAIESCVHAIGMIESNVVDNDDRDYIIQIVDKLKK